MITVIAAALAKAVLAKAGTGHAAHVLPGGAIHHGTTALVPVKLAHSFELAAVLVQGLFIARHSDEFLELIDLRVIKRWFAANPAPGQGIPFTAKGKRSDGKFRVEPPSGPGPFSMLQGVVGSDRSVVTSHRTNGIALYLPSQYATA